MYCINASQFLTSLRCSSENFEKNKLYRAQPSKKVCTVKIRRKGGVNVYEKTT